MTLNTRVSGKTLIFKCVDIFFETLSVVIVLRQHKMWQGRDIMDNPMLQITSQLFTNDQFKNLLYKSPYLNFPTFIEDVFEAYL